MRNNKFFKQIRVVYWGVLLALLAFATISFILVAKIGAAVSWERESLETLKSVIILLALGGIPAGFVFHNKMVRKISPDLTLDDKLRLFRNSFFIKIATIEALCILSLIGFIASAHFSFFHIFALLFVTYVLNVPLMKKIEKELALDDSDDL
jgi:hypothetical protein